MGRGELPTARVDLWKAARDDNEIRQGAATFNSSRQPLWQRRRCLCNFAWFEKVGVLLNRCFVGRVTRGVSSLLGRALLPQIQLRSRLVTRDEGGRGAQANSRRRTAAAAPSFLPGKSCNWPRGRARATHFGSLSNDECGFWSPAERRVVKLP